MLKVKFHKYNNDSFMLAKFACRCTKDLGGGIDSPSPSSGTWFQMSKSLKNLICGLLGAFEIHL